MEKMVQKSVIRGRPFGGTATLVHSKWRNFVKVIATVDRYVIISLGKLLLINIYLPNNCFNIMHEITTLFDEISVYLEQFPDYIPVWGGDFNVNLHVPSGVSNYINMFMTKYSIDLCDLL